MKQEAGIMNPTIMTILDALHLYPALSKNINAYGDDKDNVIIWEGASTLQGNLILDDYMDEAVGIIVNGDLTISGDLLQMDVDCGPFLLILGNLSARCIDKAGCEICVLGDCQAEMAIYGYYNGGSLTVHGTTNAKYLVADDHDYQLSKIDPQTITIDTAGYYPEFIYSGENVCKALNPSVLDDDGGYIDNVKFMKCVRDGNKIVKPAW